MGIALRARDRNPLHAERIVMNLPHIFFRNRFPKARPPRAGIEFRRGIKQRVVATDAAVDSLVVNIPTLSTVCEFRICVSCDLKYA